jgi:hypothetical protein
MCESQKKGPRLYYCNERKSLSSAYLTSWSRIYVTVLVRRCQHGRGKADRPVCWSQAGADKAPQLTSGEDGDM